MCGVRCAKDFTHIAPRTSHMSLADTHCHLYFDNYHRDLDSVLARAGEAGVERILVPGIDLVSSQAAVDLAERYPSIYAAVGVHPNSATTWDSTTLEALEGLAAHPKVVAIGELGLDYYRQRAPHSLQKRVLREQIELAGQLELPLVVHTRNTSEAERACIKDVLEILIAMRDELPANPGVIHSFSGNYDEALRAMEHGFYIGITGPVTYKKAYELRDVVRGIALDRLLIETDGPFLTPHPYRGKRNEPAYVYYVAEKIAQVLGRSPKEIAQRTTSNAGRLFGWRDIG